MSKANNKKNIREIKLIGLVIIFCLQSTVLFGCKDDVENELVSESIDTEISDDIAQDTHSEANSLIRHHNTVHEYTHGDDGYYNIADDVVFEQIGQVSGTCWICASACAMMTSYQLDHDDTIELDQIDLLNMIYNNEKDEGVFIGDGVDKGKYGGLGYFVMNELNRCIFDGLTLDEVIDAKGWSEDEIKDGIREYGALYIGIPDTDSEKGNYDGYYTMNHPDAKDTEFDHSIAVLGWDDNFPKEYFNDEPSRNGAWITVNSNYPLDYFYVSYDTPFDEMYDTSRFMSVTDEYSKILSYDCGMWMTSPVSTGGKTTTANVFEGEGTLAAVGTYTVADDQDLLIRIMTPDLTECLYSQECHADRKGYHVFKLEKPVEVREYAIAVTYPKGAPVEGEPFELDNALRVETTSNKDQSFIFIDDVWSDMSDENTWERLGCVTNNACIKALYTE